MKAEFTANFVVLPEGGCWAMCSEIPGANGHEETLEEAKDSLREAIYPVLGDRREGVLRGLSDDVLLETVLVG